MSRVQFVILCSVIAALLGGLSGCKTKLAPVVDMGHPPPVVSMAPPDAAPSAPPAPVMPDAGPGHDAVLPPPEVKVPVSAAPATVPAPAKAP